MRNEKRQRRVLVWLYSQSQPHRNMLHGICEYIAQGAPWITQVMNLDRPLPKWIRHWKPDGMIASVTNPAMLRRVERMKIKTIAVHMWSEGKLPTVTVDEEAIGRCGAEHLMAQGLKHFAYFNMDRPNDTVRERGFVQTLEVHGLGCTRFRDSHSPMTWNSMDQEMAAEAVRGRHGTLSQWLMSLPKPVGILAFNDYVASVLIQVCQSIGLELSRQVAIVGVDNDPLICELNQMTISSVSTHMENVGRVAAQMLDRLMNGQAMPSPVIRTPVVGVIQRQSSRVLDTSDEVLAAATKYIRQNAHRPFGVKEMADALAVSSKTLQRRFRKIMGRRMLTEIYLAHVERAQQLMLTTDLPLTQIARRSGFGSPQQFFLMFKKLVGTSPKRYIQQKAGQIL